ncbi:MAG: glutathione S-transferase family protein [Lautropia sp.]
MPLELFHSHISTCSQKVRLCLAEKGIDWVDRPIDLSRRENLTPEFLAINPNGVVPAFRHDGQPIFESTVMCEYLEEAFPDTPRLSPDSALGRAQMRAWLRFIDEVPSMAIRVPSFQNVFLPAFQSMSEEAFAAFADDNPLRKDFFLRMGRTGFSRQEYDIAIERLDRSLARIDSAIQRTPWLSGDRYTNADVCLLPVIVRLEDLGLSAMMERYPHALDWYRRSRERPAFDVAFYPGSRISHLRPGYAALAC